MRAGAILLTVAAAVAYTSLDAQEMPGMNDPVTIPQSTVFDIHSDEADADFQIWIATPVPGMIPFPPGPRHVLYVLDANLFFGTAVEMTRIMSALYRELPPMIVVGIAYHPASPATQAELRARDFTPTVDVGMEAAARGWPGAPRPTLPEGRRLGRAEEFLTFLVEAVKPFVEERYDVSAGSTLFGSSLGGLFVLHTLLQRPDAFDAFISVSPALWWDDELLLKQEENLAPPLEDLEARLFLAVGSEEERSDIPGLAQFRMVSNVRTFAERLAARGYPSLDVGTYVAEGESHTTVVPLALTRGLRYIHRVRP
jgi:uncharacterized protein